MNNANSNDNHSMSLMIGDKAPTFKAQTTKGDINFPADYWNKWVVLFSHPADFTPVCTSELMKFADLSDEFEKLDCKLIGLSVDGISSHIQWIKEMEEIDYNGMKNIKINYPLISDVNLEISKKFGMISANASSTKTIRSVFIIDDKQKIQAILMYPITTGRDIHEILRLVEALKTVESDDVATPEAWRPGDGVFLLPESDKDKAMDRYKNQGDGYECPAWFMCIKPGKK